jgi:hypothetical protein
MKRFIQTTLVATGLALAAQGAHAGVAGDLLLGINNNAAGGTQDYVFDLGQGLAPNTVIDLGIPTSTLQGAAPGGIGPGPISGWNVGIIGGKNGIFGNTGNFIISSVIGGGSAPNNVSVAQVGNAGGIGKGLAAGGVTGIIGNTSVSSFTVDVAKDSATPGTAVNSFFSFLGGVANPNADPLQVVGATDKITLDLYKDTVTGSGASQTTSGWQLLGSVLVDFSGPGDAMATFDPVAVPEPGTYGLIAGAGLLALSLRRQFLKNA